MVECEGTLHTALLSPVLVGSLCLSMQVTASAPDDSERHFSCFAQLIEVVCGKLSLSLLYCSTVCKNTGMTIKVIEYSAAAVRRFGTPIDDSASKNKPIVT